MLKGNEEGYEMQTVKCPICEKETVWKDLNKVRYGDILGLYCPRCRFAILRVEGKPEFLDEFEARERRSKDASKQ